MFSFISSIGPARLLKLEPAECVRYVSISNYTYFQLWIIGRPLPRLDQWHWKFKPSGTSGAMVTNPKYVYLSVSGSMAILNISYVTKNHYGSYFVWTSNKYGGWKEGNLEFNLSSNGMAELIQLF